MKKLLILENDAAITKIDHRYSFRFKELFDGEVEELTHVSIYELSEILEKFKSCSHIVFQTCLAGGSQNQVPNYLNLLKKVYTPVNVHMALLSHSVYDEMSDWFSPKELVELSHHNFFELEFDVELDERIKSTKISFSDIIEKYKKEQAEIKHYKDTAVNRKTGRKIKILTCTAFSGPFKDLPIGEIVDELIMDEQDPNKQRGVWIQGNGEPVKLVNDTGVQEYEIVISENTPEQLIDAAFKTCSINRDNFEDGEILELIQMIAEKENSTSIANIICEIAGIEKRGNRSRIAEILRK